MSFIQRFGIGTAIAILVDATLIRGVLVPAFMKLARGANWWAPGAAAAAASSDRPRGELIWRIAHDGGCACF